MSNIKIRDIGIYDDENLLEVIRNAKSYHDAFRRFRIEYPQYQNHYEYTARNFKLKSDNPPNK